MEEALPIPVHDLKDVSTVAAIIEQSALFQTLADLLDARDACICFLLTAHGTYDAAAVLCAAIAVLVDHRFFWRLPLSMPLGRLVFRVQSFSRRNVCCIGRISPAMHGLRTGSHSARSPDVSAAKGPYSINISFSAFHLHFCILQFYNSL